MKATILAEIETGSAAEGDDPVMAARPEGGDAGGEIDIVRIGIDLG